MGRKESNQTNKQSINMYIISFSFLCKTSCICNLAIFVRIFMKFSPNYRTKKILKIN